MAVTTPTVEIAVGPARAPINQGISGRPWPWMAPLIILLSAFYLYPIFDAVRVSFTDASQVGDTFRYTTDSYRAVLGSPEFGAMAWTTAVFVLASVIGQLALGFLIAALVCEGERRRLPGSLVVRSAVLVGWVLPGVVLGIIWRLLLDESGAGILASWLTELGASNPIFLSAPGSALVWVIVANVWRGTAFSMIIQYSAMKTIPPEITEAATLDGAGAWRRLRYIVLPSLRRILLINLVLITISTLNTFDMIVPLTGGGPGRATEVVALYIYNLVFVEFSLAQGAASAVLLMLTGITLTLVYFRFILSEQDEDESA